MELELSLEFLRVVEEAAVAAARTMGEGNAHKSDQMAVEAMRRALDQLPIELQPQGPCAEVRGGSYDDPAIAGPKIHHLVGGRDLRQLQHASNQGVRRRNPHHVLARLAARRLVRCRLLCRQRCAAQECRKDKRARAEQKRSGAK